MLCAQGGEGEEERQGSRWSEGGRERGREGERERGREGERERGREGERERDEERKRGKRGREGEREGERGRGRGGGGGEGGKGCCGYGPCAGRQLFQTPGLPDNWEGVRARVHNAGALRCGRLVAAHTLRPTGPR